MSIPFATAVPLDSVQMVQVVAPSNLGAGKHEHFCFFFEDDDSNRLYTSIISKLYSHSSRLLVSSYIQWNNFFGHSRKFPSVF